MYLNLLGAAVYNPGVAEAAGCNFTKVQPSAPGGCLLDKTG